MCVNLQNKKKTALFSGKIYTADKEFYTTAGRDGRDKFQVCGGSAKTWLLIRNGLFRYSRTWSHIGYNFGDKPFKCDHCNYSTIQAGRLKRHKIQLQHSGDKPFKCIQCDYSAFLEILEIRKLKHTGDKH